MYKEVLTFLGYAICVGAVIAMYRMALQMKAMLQQAPLPEEVQQAPLPEEVQLDCYEPEYALEDADIYLIARLVEAEAGNQTKEGKQAVAWVVFCRYMFYRTKGLKCTIESVITQAHQFCTPAEKPKKSTLEAVYDVFEIVNGEIVGETIFPDDLFYFRTKHYFEHYGYPWAQIGDHYFSTINMHENAPASFNQ